MDQAVKPINHALTAAAMSLSAVCFGVAALAQSQTPPSLVTPNTVETRIGTLKFKDGAPNPETAAAVYDNLDFTYAFRAFTDTMEGVSVEAIRQGFHAFGAKDNEVVIWSDLLGAETLMLTANADTVYVISFLDLNNGPMVLEVPPRVLGAIDDHWQRWITDTGIPGPDRGEGGKYLVVPPGYEGELPQGGFYVAHSRTNVVWWFGRLFLENHNDPKPPADTVREHMKIYLYVPGGLGTPIAEYLAGEASSFGRIEEPPATVFHEASGKAMNTVLPNDFSYYEMLNDLVQSEPATALDPELMGPIAAIGIKKGQDFAPDERMKTILTEAMAVANATGRTLGFVPRDKSWYFYDDSQWWNPLFAGGYQFETPVPEITPEGAKPFPPTGYRQNSARTSFIYMAIGITPAMVMRLTGVGSQYLVTGKDGDGNFFDGAKTYKVTLPKGIPAEAFWSFTLYDNQTRSMLQTPQKYPRAGSQSYPSPAAEADADGATTVWFAPEQPDGVARGNWIQTDPEKGWFTVLRLYSPLEPFFDKTWRPSEIERVK